MTWQYVTKTLIGEYQLHNTSVLVLTLCFFFYLYHTYKMDKKDYDREKALADKDIEVKFNYIGEKLKDIKDDNEIILGKVDIHDKQIFHLESKFKDLIRGKKKEHTSEEDTSKETCQ